MFIANEIDQLFRSVRSDMSDMALLAERAMFLGCKSYKHSAPPEHSRWPIDCGAQGLRYRLRESIDQPAMAL